MTDGVRRELPQGYLPLAFPISVDRPRREGFVEGSSQDVVHERNGERTYQVTAKRRYKRQTRSFPRFTCWGRWACLHRGHRLWPVISARGPTATPTMLELQRIVRNRRLGLPPPGIGVGEVRRRNCRLPDVAWGDSCDAIDVSTLFSCKETMESEPRPRFGVLREYRWAEEADEVLTGFSGV